MIAHLAAINGPTAMTLLPRVLLVDDDPRQCRLVALRLRAEGFQVATAASAEQALELALAAPPDAIMSDVIMAGLDGFELCRRIREEPSLAAVPVILLSAHYRNQCDTNLARRVGACCLVTRTPGFEVELEALRRGLSTGPPPADHSPMADAFQDHLQSTTNQLSVVAVQARRAEQRYQALLDAASDVVSVLTPDGLVLEINLRAEQVLGVRREELVGRHMPELTVELASLEAFAEGGTAAMRRVVPFRRPDGSLVQLDISANLVEIEGQHLILSIARDVTAIVATNDALAAAKDHYRSVVERIPDVVWTTDADRKITFITSNVADVLGLTRDEIYASGPEAWTSHIHPEDLAAVLASDGASFDGGTPLDIEFRWARGANRWIWLRTRSAFYDRDGLPRREGMISDITEKRRLEENLRQAQKLEAIGRLTGGIAHDFNNVLASILASSHFLLSDLSDADPRRADADEIRISAERAAALTRQLLAFGRRQVLEPVALDLNVTVSGLERMLRRLIGEDIEIRMVKGADLGTVMADAGQIEQVVMNLVVNARDAMPSGGSLSIETSNVDLDSSQLDSPAPVAAGRYVMIAVSDSGCGMSAETQLRAFEPFFTTKERDGGTGLGLSTCYGIVKQSGGHISIYSELGAGTVFKVYLPRVDRPPSEIRLAAPASGLRGSETVLMVEDDDRVRGIVQRILVSYGYRVLVARNGAEAIQFAKRQEGGLDLILSDVIIPGLSGPDTVKEIQKNSTKAKALFMSGYTDHAILRDGVLQPGMSFIQKPFAPDALARRIREVLDA
jgi:two-component system, cell cycle sensor histidine kinase and response regulator CckA